MPDRETQYEFVQLNRTFHELSKHARESDDVDLSQAFYAGNQLTWDDLVKGYRTVILSEAGSGKTEEIRQAALKLRAEGKAAFFLRLEHIPDDFDNAFEVGSVQEFEEWLASGNEGWLLLDSVDEARLRNPGDFERAIRKLGRRILTAKDRTHLVLTGRTPAWRPKTDLALCEQQIPFTPPTTAAEVGEVDTSDELDEAIRTEQRPEEDTKPTFKIVALDDLSRDQIETFARARGVIDTKALLEAIERADAWSFTSRPLDLEELTEFWLDKGRVGGRLELMRNSIDRRLAERDQDRADARPLSSQRARVGARLIAAATTLAQDPAIQVPDGADNTRGISLRSVLPDWDDKEQATLLSRPIFDEAIYGTVRFHHRSAREYLTAEWLAELLLRPASRRSIEALLFRTQYGLDVIVPTMRPILPWLAILDEKLRERLRRIAPEVLFEGGDPSALPLPTRRIILAEVCEQIASGTSGRSATDYAAVQRFSNSDLADDVRDLLVKYVTNDELRGFLIRMVWLGELTALLPEAKEIALSSKTSRYTRIAAFRAVRAIGIPADQKELRESFLAEGPILNREWLGELLTEVEPTPETISWLLAALEKTQPKERYSVDRLTDAFAAFVGAAPIDLMPDLLAGLARLLDQPPFVERGYCEVSEKFMWLMKGASLAVERLIRARNAHALHKDSLGILYKLRAAREWMDDVGDIKVEFAKLVPEWVELNRASLWYDVHTSRDGIDKKHGNRLTNYWQAGVFGAFWKFAGSDFDYVSDAIGTLADQDDKLVALSLAFNLYVENGRPCPWCERLRTLVAGNTELTERLTNFLNPPPQDEALRRQEQGWKKQAAAREKRQKEQHENSKKFLLEHVDGLRDPNLNNPSDVSSAQWYLHEQTREKNGSSSRWTEGRWRDLIPEYGEDVARAYRDGTVAYWRKYKPALRSQGAPANTTPIQAIFGLTGLEIEANETPGWPTTLTPDDIELACRYASYELNGFPTWFPKLFAAHPGIVAKFLLQEIDYELSIEKANEETHYVLSDVSWSGEWAWRELAPALYTILEKKDPESSFNLSKLLKIIQGSDISDGELTKLAASKAQTVSHHPHAAHWYAVWVGVDPDKAIPALADRLGKLPSDPDRTAFAMNFVTHLWGGRRSETTGARSAFHTPQHLKALYLLMHKYIRQSADIDRSEGGVYSPGLRDDAQDSRNSLFEFLNKIPGKDAFLAVEEISKAHPEEASRPWFISLTKRKAEQDADIQPWSPAHVRDFHDKLERTPTNHRDLAELVVLRLLDLKDDLENGDSSVAGILRRVEEEIDMRNYLGHELREKAFGRYVIPQEEELADAKRPDLRFHGIGFDAPVPVELKLADNWTGPQLFERLENQLAGDYLRDNRSRRGIFALMYRGEKVGWDVPGSANRADFDGLIEALRKHWKTISVKFPGVDEITVIGIDFTKRFT